MSSEPPDSIRSSGCTHMVEDQGLLGRSKHLRASTTDLPLIPDTLHDGGIRALWGPGVWANQTAPRCCCMIEEHLPPFSAFRRALMKSRSPPCRNPPIPVGFLHLLQTLMIFCSTAFWWTNVLLEPNSSGLDSWVQSSCVPPPHTPTCTTSL